MDLQCKECGHVVAANVHTCPKCGHENLLYDAIEAFVKANVIFHEMVMMDKISAHFVAPIQNGGI